MKKACRVINLYGGPGTGKSTTAAGVFSELKQRGVNCEYIQEYAKDAAWENRGAKLFAAQEYIFAKQHFRLSRVASEVDLIVTDCPLLLGLVYMPKSFPMPSLRKVIREAYDMYDNLDIFLHRVKAYNPKGRLQTEEQAKKLDGKFRKMLQKQNVWKHAAVVTADRSAINEVIWHAQQLWGEGLPALHSAESK